MKYLSFFCITALLLCLTGCIDSNSKNSDYENQDVVNRNIKVDAKESKYLVSWTNHPDFTNGEEILINNKGMALYMKKGPCDADCEKAWPPLMRDFTYELPIHDFSYVQRGNGDAQYAYKKRPLYYYVGDEPGTVNGHGINNEWFVVTK